MKNRILLKLSGEGLANKQKRLVIDPVIVDDIAQQLKIIKKELKTQIAIVIGGGNLWRGESAAKNGMGRNRADYIGMLATIMNGKALQDGFEKHGLKCRVMSSLNMDPKVAQTYVNEKAIHSLNKGEIIIFVGGTGRPFFTTDTAATLFASEIKASKILMGKNGVDGIYSDDPKINPEAIHYEKITYDEIIKKELKVMDITATSMARDNNIKLTVFDITKKDAIINVIKNKVKHTEVTN
ncbi:UMP kinase [Mycoplasma phocimorsus]|uniref:Uridylate kinase n=1 Tax=Mycoplasma phocimorsus TaxID=3045839 RepID=A0AAJ1UWU0_9MOLU|nr:UMP kinase [Mycoplasma phocimorsus]MDJ1645700.1 UMP kinase [Mycoplasma phocimorsus]MDJ1646520.1 UMP kinase [Mycoplasma phocimorsus]MDJ1647099.1 UMP kinase [Mycoplasma phocimorsus]MDJ1647367.1 UMP kinase [Mycoplasma phocimorsus]MDJ1648519.1 UMP kinase [Mycoplasma phocimorsus]